MWADLETRFDATDRGWTVKYVPQDGQRAGVLRGEIIAFCKRNGQGRLRGVADRPDDAHRHARFRTHGGNGARFHIHGTGAGLMGELRLGRRCLGWFVARDDVAFHDVTDFQLWIKRSRKACGEKLPRAICAEQGSHGLLSSGAADASVGDDDFLDSEVAKQEFPGGPAVVHLVNEIAAFLREGEGDSDHAAALEAVRGDASMRGTKPGGQNFAPVQQRGGQCEYGSLMLRSNFFPLMNVPRSLTVCCTALLATFFAATPLRAQNVVPLDQKDITLPKRQRADGYVEPDLPLRYIPTPF